LFAWFDKLVEGMTWLINFFYGLTQNIGIPSYGLAIILFTIVVKTILYPLTLKQMRSLKMTQLLQPKVKEIQDKYSKEPQKAQQLIMELYKENGANPLAGCLPILLQMPIFIALFNALKDFKFVDLASAKFLWIHTLSLKDPYYILPIVAAAATYTQQKLSTTNPDDPTQKSMLYVMPLMFGWFASTVPAGLGLYWVVFSVMGTIQQYFINKQPVALKEDGKKDESVRKKRKDN
jgi:YidC/Oxa1 family membrane protein insertase